MLNAEDPEPTTPEMVADWVAGRRTANDRFLQIYERSEAHRIEHGPECEVYPTSNGPLLGVLAASMSARRILEIGCGLGYSGMWLLHGAGMAARLDTCESDGGHADLAQATFEQDGVGDRVTVHRGSALATFAGLDPPYDLIFLDGDPGEYPQYAEHLFRLIRTGGLLVSSNLFLGVYVPDAPYLEQAAAFREMLLTDARGMTAFLTSGLALTTKL